MKNLILLFILISFSLNAQIESDTLVGEALVVAEYSGNARIYFNKINKYYWVKDSTLVEGKYYDFIFKPKSKKKGSKQNAEIYYRALSTRQLTLDLRAEIKRLKYNVKQI